MFNNIMILYIALILVAVFFILFIAKNIANNKLRNEKISLKSKISFLEDNNKKLKENLEKSIELLENVKSENSQLKNIIVKLNIANKRLKTENENFKK